MNVATYFIQRGPGGPIKIGKSRDPRKRLGALSTASAEELVLLAVVNGDREQEFHQTLIAHRIRGEWFRPDEEVLKLAFQAAAESPFVPVDEMVVLSTRVPQSEADAFDAMVRRLSMQVTGTEDGISTSAVLRGLIKAAINRSLTQGADPLPTKKGRRP